MTRALISGVAGQDGSYLADILLERGYEVHGIYRHSSKVGLQNVQHNIGNPKFHLHQGDVTDALCLDRIVDSVDAHEIYHEADQDNVDWSFKFPAYQMDVTVKAVMNLMDSVRRHCPSARVFIPCSATMFGNAPAPQDENTPFNPQSPYACAKVAAYHIARMYRQNYGMFVTTGILFNHDSPRRNGNYLLHKICKALVNKTRITMFDVHQEVAIGYARDYMMHVVNLMQLSYSSDFVIQAATPITLQALMLFAGVLTEQNHEDVIHCTKSTHCTYRSPTLLANTDKLHDAVGTPDNTDTLDLLDMIINKYRSEQCVSVQ